MTTRSPVWHFPRSLADIDVKRDPYLAASIFIMSCYLYYEKSRSILPDGDFDELGKQLAEEWDRLDSDQHWALGSPDDIRASGHHVMVHERYVSAARTWWRHIHPARGKKQKTAEAKEVWPFDPNTDRPNHGSKYMRLLGA